MSEANKALVRRFYEEGLNKRNMAVLDELLDPCYVYHGVVEGDIKGIEAMKKFLASLYAAIPDDQHLIQEQIAEGDKVVTRFKSTGTPQIEFMGIAPSGKRATVDEITISRITDGRIVEDWNTWDFFGLLQQLGAVPPASVHEIARKTAFNATKAAYSLYGGFLKDVAQEMGMERALSLHARRYVANYAMFAGMITERTGSNELDLSTFSAALKELSNAIFGITFEVEENPNSVRFNYHQCPVYEGFRSAGLDHQTIDLICTRGESAGMAELERIFPQVSCSLKFRSTSEQPCEFVFEK
jgi:steroid delta-isomerase-like uncharacterized protein